MNKHTTTQNERFERAMAQLEMGAQAGVLKDPLYQFYLRNGFSPLGNGKHADKAQAIFDNLVTGRAILAKMQPPSEPPEPDLDPKLTVFVGRRRAYRKMTGILRRLLTTHLLIQGPSGTGKTNLIWYIIQQLTALGVKIVFHDHKNEGRKLLRYYPGVVVLRVSDFRENFFKPVGDPKQYYTSFWSEFARTYRLRRETAVKMIAISLRVLAGLKSEDPYPSLHDFACMLHRMAETERDTTLDTAAVALDAANATLGETAMVREGSCAEDMFQVVVVQCHGLPPEFLQFFMGIRLLRTHVKAIMQGHSGELATVIVSDEGGIEFAKELTSDPGSGFITPQKRMITQFRSAGIGVIIGAQSVSAIDPTVSANVGSFVCIRAQTDADVRISGRLLGLPDDRLEEVRRVPQWSGLFKSPSHSGPVLVDIPETDMGDYLSDAELDALNKPSLDRLNTQAIFSPLRNDIGNPILYREILGETSPAQEVPVDQPRTFDIRDEHRTFVQEVASRPDASVVEHYGNLKWSSGRGTRVKSELIDNRVLESKRQTSRSGRPVERLVLTAKGKELFHDLET